MNISTQKKKLRQHYKNNSSNGELLPLEEARNLKFDYGRNQPVAPNTLGIHEFQDLSLSHIEPYIDWTPFFRGWGLRGKYPSIFAKDRVGPEAERLFEEARQMLEKIREKDLIRPKGVYGIFPANSAEDDIVIYKDEHRRAPHMKLPMLRQQRPRGRQRDYTLSLADYVAPQESGIVDYFGSFAVTTGMNVDNYLEEMSRNGNSFDSVMIRLLADRLVEATAEALHEWVRKQYWGYAPQENLDNEERIKAKYRGIRPAVGYPACPDHGIEKHLFSLLEVEERVGITLTDSFAMKPAGSVTGFYLAHEDSRYFGIGKIGRDQLEDYAARVGQDSKEVEKRLYFALDQKPK